MDFYINLKKKIGFEPQLQLRFMFGGRSKTLF